VDGSNKAAIYRDRVHPKHAGRVDKDDYVKNSPNSLLHPGEYSSTIPGKPSTLRNCDPGARILVCRKSNSMRDGRAISGPEFPHTRDAEGMMGMNRHGQPVTPITRNVCGLGNRIDLQCIA
jgi:hypothetical protein